MPPIYRPVIALVGPHAIGKTTTTDRWASEYPSIRVIHCDGKIPERDSKRIVILEGCSAHANQWLQRVPVKKVIHCYCGPDDMANFMKARCLAKNKPYREDYWTRYKLIYESSGRMNNYLKRYNIPSVEFQIKDRHQDWVKVDEYFSELIEKLGGKNEVR